MEPEDKRLGEKLRAIRVARGYTQKELAKTAGVGESALRSYELGDRMPKSRQLQKIAMALKVRPEALCPSSMNTDMDIIYSLFEFEDLGAIEATGDASLTVNQLSGNAGVFNRTFKEWAAKKAALEAGELTVDNYAEWKRTYNPHTTMGDNGKPVEDPYTGIKWDHKDNEHVPLTARQSPFLDDMMDELSDGLKG